MGWRNDRHGTVYPSRSIQGRKMEGKGPGEGAGNDC